MASPKNPWDAKLNATKREEFTQWLCTEILNAESARSVPLPENEYWWTLYEQGRTRSKSSMPWQDAADLTSYLGTEKVDALRARIMRTIFVEPIFTVEGWGESAKQAPFVEDFHQWQAESEGLQQSLGRAIQASLIETRGVLEVYEDTTMRTTRKTIRARIGITPDNAPILDETFKPVFIKDEQENFIESADPNVATAETIVDIPEKVRTGPGYRVLPYKHFLVLPGHARERSDIWGYAKQFSRRWDLLKEDAKNGLYDKTAIEELNDSPDITEARTLSGENEPVAAQEGDTSEKELWEVQLLHDCGQGLRWYLATVHLPSQTLLRLKYENAETHRYILLVPFPRSDKSHEGYSYIGQKLITTIEEHTAWRNMLADRAAFEVSAPIKRVQGALWDPDLQPFGPKAVIDVRDHKEVELMQIPPAMQGAITREQEIVAASERIAGMTDVVIGGDQSSGDSTLGEFNVRTEQVMVRMDEVIKNLQEPLEELGQVRHAIWVNVLKEKGANGLSAPTALFDRQSAPGLETRGGDVAATQSVTAEMIEGTFRFKPRGSTETADRGKQRQDSIQFMQALGIAFKTWPALMQVVGMNIPAAKSMIENLLRLFNMPDKQAWLGSPMWQTLGQQPMGMPGMGMPPPGMGGPPQPGAPPGGPPSGPPGMPLPPGAPPNG